MLLAPFWRYGAVDLASSGSGAVWALGEMALTSKECWLRLAYAVAVLTLASLAPTSARADFFDDTRRTFQTDIPHFFQDDIPCAFGGQPTSHTKTSCKSPAHPTRTAVAPPSLRTRRMRLGTCPRVPADKLARPSQRHHHPARARTRTWSTAPGSTASYGSPGGGVGVSATAGAGGSFAPALSLSDAGAGGGSSAAE
jgi:hypothetical protein